MQLWMASVPLELRQLIFVEANSWYEAREICRILYQDPSLEGNWTRMRVAALHMLYPGDSIFYRNGKKEVQKRIVSKTEAAPEKRLTAKKRRKN